MSTNIATTNPGQQATPFQMDNPVFDAGQFSNMMQVAEVMATAKLVPEHLQKSPGDCLLVVEQARRWNMSPFAVAQETYVVKGKMLFGGKLVTAVINSRAPIKAPLRFDFEGEGESCVVTASATLRGDDEPRTYSISVKDAKAVAGTSSLWKTDPKQQACYFAARFWARRHCPEVILGVWSEDEMRAEHRPMRDVTPARSEALVEIVDAYGEARTMTHAEAVESLRDAIKAATAEDLDALYEGNADLIDVEARLALAMSDARASLSDARASLGGHDPETGEIADDTPERPHSIPVPEDAGKKLWKVWVTEMERRIDAADLDDLQAWQKQNAPQLDGLKERSATVHESLMLRFADRARALLGEGGERVAPKVQP